MKKSINIFELFLKVYIILIILQLLILTITPPYSRDALIHHLAIPKLWIKHGGFYEIPWAPFSYYPMNIELLYMLCLIIGNDILSKVIHLLFTLGVSIIIYKFIRKKISSIYGLLGSIIWLTTPIVTNVGTIAYIDIGLTFFIFISLILIIDNLQKSLSLRNIILSSIFTGLALGSKYNALIAYPLLISIIFLREIKFSPFIRVLKISFSYIIISSIIASPWYIKNYILTGNPIYPRHLPIRLHKMERINNTKMQANHIKIETRLERTPLLNRKLIYGENILEIMAVPIRIFFQGKDDNARYFDGVLNPIFLIFFPFAFLLKKYRRDTYYLGSFAWYFILMVFFLENMRVRWILPALPMLTIITIYGIKAIYNRKSIFLKITIGMIITCLIGYNAIYSYKRLIKIKPYRYILKKETRDEFLLRTVGSYKPIKWLNNNLPENAKVLFILIGHRGYYCDRDYRLLPNFGEGLLDNLVKINNYKNTLSIFKNLGVTHILANHYLIFKYLNSKYDIQTIEGFKKNMIAISDILYNDGPYSILKLKYYINQ